MKTETKKRMIICGWCGKKVAAGRKCKCGFTTLPGLEIPAKEAK